MKKIILMLAFVATTALTASADNYNFLTVLQSDGTEQSFTASGLTITFSNGNMLVTEGETTVTLALSDLSKMYFSDTAVDGIKAVGETAQTADAGEVFDLQGRRVAEQMRLADISSQLPKGVYVVRQGKTSVKVTVK